MLFRSVGILQIDGNNECAALRGGKGLMDVGYQKGEEPDPQFPDRKGYTELKRVYDLSGNDPSKPGAAPQPQGNGGVWSAAAIAARSAPAQSGPGFRAALGHLCLNRSSRRGI